MAEIDSGASSAFVAAIERVLDAGTRLDERAADNPALTPRQVAHIDAILRGMERAQGHLRRLIIGHAPVVEGLQRLSAKVSMSVVGSERGCADMLTFPAKGDNFSTCGGFSGPTGGAA